MEVKLRIGRCTSYIHPFIKMCIAIYDKTIGKTDPDPVHNDVKIVWKGIKAKKLLRLEIFNINLQKKYIIYLKRIFLD